MRKTVLPTLACTALLAIAAGQGPDSPRHLPENLGQSPAATVLELAIDLGPQPLSDRFLARTAGAGPTSDFLCGAATGAGFALALSGVGAGLGLALAGAGMACSMFF